jgi:hypothetical protein
MMTLTGWIDPNPMGMIAGVDYLKRAEIKNQSGLFSISNVWASVIGYSNRSNRK